MLERTCAPRFSFGPALCVPCLVGFSLLWKWSQNPSPTQDAILTFCFLCPHKTAVVVNIFVSVLLLLRRLDQLYDVRMLPPTGFHRVPSHARWMPMIGRRRVTESGIVHSGSLVERVRIQSLYMFLKATAFRIPYLERQ
jgi:hypothetical protein